MRRCFSTPSRAIGVVIANAVESRSKPRFSYRGLSCALFFNLNDAENHYRSEEPSSDDDSARPTCRSVAREKNWRETAEQETSSWCLAVP